MKKFVWSCLYRIFNGMLLRNAGMLTGYYLFGSRASRRPSPMKLNAITARKMKIPGMSIQG